MERDIFLQSLVRGYVVHAIERASEIREESRVRAGTQILNCDSSVIDRTFGFYVLNNFTLCDSSMKEGLHTPTKISSRA